MQRTEEQTALIKKTMQYIKDHPNEHQQRYMAQKTESGTKFCFAGTAMVLSGYEPEWTPRGFLHCWKDPEGKVVNHSLLRAKDLLGLTSGQAEILFSDYATLEDVHYEVKALLGEPV